MKIALLGNANCGKTTLFNLLTKSSEATGNRAGVTFGAKEAPLKSKKYTAEIVDLPGIYSLTSQKAEEKVALDYLRRGDCDVIVDIIDASNLSRGLFLTLQLIREFPHVVVALTTFSRLHGFCTWDDGYALVKDQWECLLMFFPHQLLCLFDDAKMPCFTFIITRSHYFRKNI